MPSFPQGPRTLRDAVERQVADRGDAPFLIVPESGRRLGYRELQALSRRLAGFLAARGIGPGEVVSFMLPNSVAAVGVFIGAMAGGFVVSPLNLVAQDSQLEYVVVHSGTRLVFTSEDLADRLRAIIARTAAAIELVVIDVDQPDFGDGDGAWREALLPEQPAMLMYTSGTTGTPKGVLLSHANMLHSAQVVVNAQELGPGDRVLSSLPLYHINGQCIATLSTLASGGGVILPARFSASRWWEWVAEHRPTWLNVVPTIIAYLLQGPELTAAQREACAGIRFARSASAPLPREHHEAFEARFGIGVLEGMGLTETASIAFANPLERHRRRLGTPGLPLGIEARVVDIAAAPLGDGVSGEIQLRGPSVMLGYYKAPEATAKTISAAGWLSTGDLGYRDADGFYFITGRLKELIIKAGENIAPREIDEALLRHPAVLDAAAVGIPDAMYGQDILACVILKPEHACSIDELHAHSLKELGRFKTPKLIRLVDELPRGPSGKVQRLRLLELQ